MSIDFEVISEFEGGCRLEGYVPDAGGSRSGVTVGTGIDLGARSERDLAALGVAPELVEKLTPYLGLRGEDAVRRLRERPLAVTAEEARALDAAVKGSFLAGLRREYDACLAPGKVAFDDLPSGIQTVIASVAFQYGTHLERRTPRFWSLITAQDWEATIGELEAFGDRYPTRRRREAELVRGCLGPGGHR